MVISMHVFSKKFTALIVIAMAYLLSADLSLAKTSSTFTKSKRIESKALGYALQYRVYLPKGVEDKKGLPTLYITDGQDYTREGRMLKALDDGISSGKIKPLIAIFVDPRDPDKLSINRRNHQFFCYDKYVEFFTKELIPIIDSSYPTSPNRDHRVILGVSFGGFNSACFGLMATDYFAGIAMHSPANSKLVRFLEYQYNESNKKDLKVYMSVGNFNDNRRAVRAFREVLINKGYDLTFRQNSHGHDWDNWIPLLPETLATFFSVDQEKNSSKTLSSNQ